MWIDSRLLVKAFVCVVFHLVDTVQLGAFGGAVEADGILVLGGQV